MFHYCSLAANCHSLTPLGLHIMCLITLFYLASAFLGKKYFRSPFPTSCRCVTIVPATIATIKSYYCNILPHIKVLSKAISPTLYEVNVPTTALSKLVRSCRIYSGGPDTNVPTLNLYVSEVVLFGLRRGLILMIFLSLISASFLIIGIGGG